MAEKAARPVRRDVLPEDLEASFVQMARPVLGLKCGLWAKLDFWASGGPVSGRAAASG